MSRNRSSSVGSQFSQSSQDVEAHQRDSVRPSRRVAHVKKIWAIGSTILAVVSVCFIGLATVRQNGLADPNLNADPLADLEQQVNNLQTYPALFMVVDGQDKPIFAVYSSDYWTNASVINSSGQDVVTMNANADGGYFSVRSKDGYTKARLGIDKSWAGLRISEGFVTEKITANGVTQDVSRDKARIELGGFGTQNYSLKFPGPTGLLAGIGESKAGSGVINIGDSKGQRRVSMFVGEDGKGLIGIYNAAGNAVAAMGEATGNNGGSLALGDGKSDPRVKMGTNDNRYGVVMTFPTGFPYVPKSGLPGSYMLGCAPGPACQ